MSNTALLSALSKSENIAIGLGLLALLVVIATLIGAIFLRLAISLYHALTGGDRSPIAVPEPDFGRAIVIMFVIMLVNIGGSAIIWCIAFVAASTAHEAYVATQLISVPVGLLIRVGMLALLLPTTLGRAILVEMCFWAVYLLICAFFLALGLGLLWIGQAS